MAHGTGDKLNLIRCYNGRTKEIQDTCNSELSKCCVGPIIKVKHSIEDCHITKFHGEIEAKSINWDQVLIILLIQVSRYIFNNQNAPTKHIQRNIFESSPQCRPGGVQLVQNCWFIGNYGFKMVLNIKHLHLQLIYMNNNNNNNKHT